LLSGGGGLVSTARDYLRFCEMLRGRGRLGKVQILRPETVEAMTNNQLTGSCYPVRIGIPFRGVGFGLGVSVVVERRGPTNPVGEYGWAGAASTDFWISPVDELSVVVLVQRMPFTNRASDLVRPLIYGALPRMQEPAIAPK
ncbi:MAG: serine hydrolase, partial [Planctomycetota bacterium]